MRRTALSFLRFGVGLLSLAVVVRAVWAAGGCETLFPDTTRGLISIPNMRVLDQHWRASQIGRLIDDPAMQPFRADLRRQFQQDISRWRDRLGLTFDDLRGVATGEIGAAVIEPVAGQAVIAILMDVTGNLEKAKGVLATVAANHANKGRKASQATVEGVGVLVFDIPGDDQDPRPGQAVYFLRENLLGAVDSLPIAQGILARAAGKVGPSLAEFAPFQKAMARVAADAPNAVPHIRWFLQPLGYIRATRTATPENQRRQENGILELFETQGFSAVQGVAGFIDLALDGYEVFHRTAVYAPGPYEKSMRMMVFPNGGDFAPPAWVPRDIASFSTFNLDTLNAFDNFGFLFDAQAGETGAWADSLEGLEKDPNGPRLNLRSELMANLENRVLLLGEYQLPITTTSERVLIAVAAKDEAKVAAAVAKFYSRDRDVKQREYQGRVIWENVPPEKPKDSERVTLGAPGKKPRRARQTQAQRQQLFPRSATTVAFGHLLIASHYDFLVKVLQEREPREALARSLDFRIVSDALNQLAPEASAGRMFSRTDEEYRATYELIRQGKMPEAETMVARLMNWYGRPMRKGAPRQQRIDGREMPDYEIVRRHLGPAGTLVVSEDGGWFLKGFMLGKEGK